MQTDPNDLEDSVGCSPKNNKAVETSGKEHIKPDYSSIRCKTALVSPNEEQYDALKRRLEHRMSESRGETVYEIGVGEGKNLETRR